MSEQPKCDGTSSSSTLNTSPNNPISVQGGSGKSGKKKQKRQNETEDDAVERFQPLDMKLLTFKPIGSEQEVSIWHAEPSVFHAFVSQFIGTFSNVNINIWPLSDRLTLINTMWKFCEVGGHPFPFAIRQHVVPEINATPVPNVNVSSADTASQAV